MLIATALTATSIAISIQVLNEFGKIKTPEARMIIGAAVVDDILAIAVLSVVSSIAADGGGVDNIDIIDVSFTILKVLGFFGIMLVAAIFVIPGHCYCGVLWSSCDCRFYWIIPNCWSVRCWYGTIYDKGI